MRENTTKIMLQRDGIGHYFIITLAVAPGEPTVRFADGVDAYIHVRALIKDATGAVLKYLPAAERNWCVTVTDMRWTTVDSTDDLIRSGTMVCLAQLLFGPRGSVIRHVLVDGHWQVFLDEWRIYPLPIDTTDLNRAIVLFLGRKIAAFPDKDESRVIKHYGPAEGQVLVRQIRSILAELMAVTPNWDRHSLASGTDMAIKQIARKHPDLDEDALAALAWYFSYSWK